MPAFVVHKHDATRLHHHPLSWGEFEGTQEARHEFARAGEILEERPESVVSGRRFSGPGARR